MCRLYTFRSIVPRKVECELLCAQESLLEQSRADDHSEGHRHGWGLGTYTGATPCVVRQPIAAYDSERFRQEAIRVQTHNAVAHIRQATIGRVRLENTHPFVHGRWLLIHNGTVAAFEQIRERLLGYMVPDYRHAILGDTDSEHLFFCLLSLRLVQPNWSLVQVVREGIRQIVEWSEREAPGADTTANIILTDGDETVGLRYGRPMWFVRRQRVHPCELCECELHVNTVTPARYRAVVVASEPITANEDWDAVPDCTLFRIGPEVTIAFESL